MASKIEPQPNWGVETAARRRPVLSDYYRWKWKPWLRKELYKNMSTTLRAVLKFTPALFKFALHEASRLQRNLDYARADISISVESWIEYDKRARSCSKEPETVQWIEHYVRKGDIVYDIGANVGAYSLIMARHLQGDCKIVAFEPSYSNFAQLCRNIHINGLSSAIAPFFIALSDQTGVQYFNYSDVQAGAALHALGESTLKFKTAFRQPMLCYRMDDAIAQLGLSAPNHIKLDVDGIEYAILKGAEKTLAGNHVKSVIVETEQGRDGSDRIKDLLQSHGFRVESEHVHRANPFNKGPYVCNVVFVRE